MANWFSARILLAGFILLLATLLVVLVVGNLRKSRTDMVLEAVRSGSDLALQKINYTETQDGRRQWSIQADSAAHDIERKVATIKNIKMVVYQQEGGEIVIEAERGKLDIEGGLVTLSGAVRLANVNGQTVFTDELIFDNKAKILRSEKPVRVTDGQMHLAGIGLRYNLEQKVFRLLSSVEASFAGDSVDLP